ncbi:NACHT, LRR and PYD domains-containing protein 12-like isoform X2 [Denticeps clupeoides]|uniref:NACHT domain-containing protein n=1 Tax=Denticeps clupeoides TaxID=299321 RepID=A0AAY3ZZN5_9TELE|nr:NACHT, LRR and PYD domains-containing protein 12-like isoform X2 [Denticeps clupeoides]
MSLSVEDEDGPASPKSGDDQGSIKRAEKHGSPTERHLSVNSDESMDKDINFRQRPHTHDTRPSSISRRCRSESSEDSIDKDINFRQRFHTTNRRYLAEKHGYPTERCLSVNSDESMDKDINFRQRPHSHDTRAISDDLQCATCQKKLKDLISSPTGSRYFRQCICDWDTSGLIQVQKTASDHCSAKQGDVVCDFCTEPKLKATHSCINCPALLCQAHTDQHSEIRALQKHTLVELTESQEQKYCPHYRVLEIFCKSDQTNICWDCAADEHKCHIKYYRDITVPDTLHLIQVAFGSLMKKSFENFKLHLNKDYPEILGSETESLCAADVGKKMTECFGNEGALRILLHSLENANPLCQLERSVKSNLKKKFKNISEGISAQGQATSLNEIFTDVYITEGGAAGVNNQHEVRQIEAYSHEEVNQDTPIKCNDIFKQLPGQRKEIRTVLSKGIAGIGKTVSVQKFILDWAEGKANQDIEVIIPLPFRDLNLLKSRNLSLENLLHRYEPHLKAVEDIEELDAKVLLIFDGLDECRHPLDFNKNELWSTVTEPTSVDVLLTNIISGNLLPSALIWITSRPAAASKIPPQHVDRLTVVRGFNDDQKEEYFRKKISDKTQADRIVRHIQTSRTLYIMCHIPVFCWISAMVLSNVLKDVDIEELPQTLTEMYTHFLLIQTSLKNEKYEEFKRKTPQDLSYPDKEMILKLGKLAFEQLVKENQIFYEDDLIDCGIDVKKASVYSSLCTEIFREEKGLYMEKVFCFVHLTIQEYLAAVHVHVSYATNSDVLNISKYRRDKDNFTLTDVHKNVVEKALQSPNGHLDLFLRFLLGLSRDQDQTILQNLLTKEDPGTLWKILKIIRKPRKRHSHSATNTEILADADETIKFIKQKIKMVLSPERSINLFHCLNELKDTSLVDEILSTFRSAVLSNKKIEPEKCSALSYVLLMSGEILEDFDLKKFTASAEGLERLLLMLKACRKGKAVDCNITSKSCETVAMALQSENSPLRELDLSYNNLTDAGGKRLCSGLMSPHCKLEKISLKRCSFTDAVCEYLTTALHSFKTSQLRELNLSFNDIQDSGITVLFTALMNPLCKLSNIRVADCNLTVQSCEIMSLVLQSENSALIELDLSYNSLGDDGLSLLCSGLLSPHCILQKLWLGECGLTADCCAELAKVLQCSTSKLINLKLRDNDLEDRGIKVLCTGLQDPNCRLQTLGMTGCLITDEGCTCLASALALNPLHLKELYLNYNHPGDTGIERLHALMMNPEIKLEKLVLEPLGDTRIIAGSRKYMNQLTLKPCANSHLLLLSEDKRSVETRDLSEIDIQSKEALPKHCYWEVDWTGEKIEVGVSSQRRKTENQPFPCLVIQRNTYCFVHNGKTVSERINYPIQRIGVYLDKVAGSLSFYCVFPGAQYFLDKFYKTGAQNRFFAAFKLYSNSTMSLCSLYEQNDEL